MEKPPIEQFTPKPEKKDEEDSSFTIEINGIEINATKKNFEYPRPIQKETGILGYERIKISGEKLAELVQNTDKEKNYDIKFLSKILMNLSEGEYPRFCYNHKLNGYSKEEKKLVAVNDFKQDRFFVQKIYDLERIKKSRKSDKDPYIFNNPARLEYIDKRRPFALFDNKTNELVQDNLYPGELTNVDLEQKNVFALNINYGFNTSISQFFLGYNTKDVCFGFPIKLDSFMSEYMEACTSLFCDKSFYKQLGGKKLLDRYEGGHLFFQIMGTILNKVATTPEIFEIIKKEYEKEPVLVSGSDTSKYVSPIKETIRNIILADSNRTIKDFYLGLNKDDKEILDYSIDCDLSPTLTDPSPRGYGDSLVGNKDETFFGHEYPELEFDLPIFIGHNKIPQLSWGHAKYAHYINEKGLNFFKFKHADHLPTKE